MISIGFSQIFFSHLAGLYDSHEKPQFENPVSISICSHLTYYITTENLFHRIKSGDAKAFEGPFNQLYPSMCVVARYYVKDDEVAEDIAHEAFINP